MSIDRIAIVTALLAACCTASAADPAKPTKAQVLQEIVRKTQPLQHDRGDRLPLYVWAAIDVKDVDLDDAALEKLILDLNDRGLGVVADWNAGGDRDKNLAAALRVSKIQAKHKLRVNVGGLGIFGIGCKVFNGDESTAHVDDEGNPFFDRSQISWGKIGCPFAMEQQFPPLQEKLAFFCKGYEDAGVNVDFMWADWEVDGPLEYNEGFAHAKKCKRCRENIKYIDNFETVQKVYRTLRGDMQKRVYADVLRKHFPDVLVGNYGIYPNDGWRYWYDFYEKPTPELPHKKDGHALHRKWFQEWPLTGYTYAMPVVYPRDHMYQWYDYNDEDYRWFRGMLLNASNACLMIESGKRERDDLADVPIISFVKYYTCDVPRDQKPSGQISEEAYRELLWHMLLRGTDTFANFCGAVEQVKEAMLLQEVYAAVMEYRVFLDEGEPVVFTVPKGPRTVVSAIRLGDRLLVRRTDFGDSGADAHSYLLLDGGKLRVKVPYKPGTCQIIKLPAGKGHPQ